MALYIAPIIAAIQGILAKYIPDLMATGNTGYPSFMEIGSEFTGIAPNPPQAWVMPVRTSIDDEPNYLAEKHEVSVRFAVIASDPEEIVAAAMVYMKAISDAMAMAQPSDWEAVVPTHTHIFEHDYGPLYERAGVMMRFPECHIEIEVAEVG